MAVTSQIVVCKDGKTERAFLQESLQGNAVNAVPLQYPFCVCNEPRGRGRSWEHPIHQSRDSILHLRFLHMHGLRLHARSRGTE